MNIYIILCYIICIVRGSVIQTIAGGGSSTTNGIAGTSYFINSALDAVVDSSGNVYICAYTQNKVLMLSTAGIISTVAGTGATTFSGDNGQATSATLYYPTRVAIDSSNNLYICDFRHNRIRKVAAATSVITTVAGTGTAGFSGDGGQATAAAINLPWAIALDTNGNIYIADTSNYRIRLVTVSTGIITTIVGTGSSGYTADGAVGTSTSITSVYSVAYSQYSSMLYFTDSSNNRVRSVSATGIITTVAGTGVASFSGDNGQATSAGSPNARSLAFDSSGNIYIGEYSSSNHIRKVTLSTGVIQSIAGSGTSTGYSGNGGEPTSAQFNCIEGISVDSSGNIYIGDSNNNVVRKITIAGTYSPTYTPSVTPTRTPTNIPTIMPTRIPTTVTPSNIPTVTPSMPTYTPSFSPSYGSGYITTFVGTGTATSTGDGGAASSATINYPQGVVFDSVNNILYVSELFGYYVRKVDMSTGIITKYAGTGTSCSGPACTGLNGAATSAQVNPTGLCLKSNGDLIIPGYTAYRVLKVSSNIITSIAGTGTATVSGDNGPATSATIKEPYSCQLDSSGNIYVADRGGNNIRKITSSTGIITTYTGSATGSSGSTGDSGAATSALLNNPYSIAIDSSNNLFIADYSNNKIRKVTASTGIISTVAGTGTASYSGDNGPATSAAIQRPKGILPDGAGGYYISDYCAIRYVSSTGVITTITGGSSCGITNGDNVIAASGKVNLPSELAYDSSGNLYVADFSNHRVRKINGIVAVPSGTPSNTPTLLPSSTPTIIPSITPSAAPSTTQPSSISPTTITPTTTLPSVLPTQAPSVTPTKSPSVTPSSVPSITPSVTPSSVPSMTPTATSSLAPTTIPSTISPTVIPSVTPTAALSISPTTITPTTTLPSASPTQAPTATPSLSPTASPSLAPTTISPTIILSATPTAASSVSPTTIIPTTTLPSVLPTQVPSVTPTKSPTATSSLAPSTISPTIIPSVTPTAALSISPTTITPTTTLPTQATPSLVPSTMSPTITPTEAPTNLLTASPTIAPTTLPSLSPSDSPTISPSHEPTATSFPSSQPSSHPTASPTQVELLLLDGFSATWSNKYVKTKAKFYLAAYIAFFCGIFFILCVLDYFHLMKARSHRLLETAFSSNLYQKSLLRSSKGQGVLAGLYQLDKDIQKLLTATGQQESVRSLESNTFDDPSTRRIEEAPSNRSVAQLLKSSKKFTFNRAFHKYLQQGRSYLGCDKGIFFSKGVSISFFSCVLLHLEPGLVEDFVLHVCTNHSFISCFMAPSGSDYSRSGRRLVFMMQNITAFFISAFTSSLFNFCGLGVLFSNAFDVLVISPVSLKLGEFTKYFYTLKYSVDLTDDTTSLSGAWTVVVKQSLVYFSRYIVFFMIICGLVLLFLSALFTFSENRDGIITQFLWQVLLVAIVYELVVSCLLFVSSYYYRVSLVVCGHDFVLLEIGTRYLEIITKTELQLNHDYVIIHQVKCWLQVDYVVSKQYALMKGLDYAPGADDSRDTIAISNISENPMYAISNAAAATRSDHAGSIVEDDDYNANNRFSSNTQESASRDSTSVKSDTKTKFLSIFANKNANGPYQTKATVNLPTNKRVSIDDQVLFQEFQQETEYDANCDNNEELFEQWKCKRKFKDNTRVSFIKTFEYFERGAQA